MAVTALFGVGLKGCSGSSTGQGCVTAPPIRVRPESTPGPASGCNTCCGSTDSDFVSHSPTLRKGPINIIVDVTPSPPAGKTIGGHVGIGVNGRCRDTFDHRTDRPTRSVDVRDQVI